MSTENLHNFQARIAADPELQQKVATIHLAAARATAEKLAALSAEIGTPFTAEELLAPRELTEAELDQVAGGNYAAWQAASSANAFENAVGINGPLNILAANRAQLALLIRTNVFGAGS